MDDNALIAEDPTHWMFSGTADLSDPAQFGKPQMNALDKFSKLSNTLGPSAIRDLIAQLRGYYPEIERVSGYRISGARPKAANTTATVK